MEIIKKSLENRVQFWSALGPFVLLLTLFTTLIKCSSQSWYLVVVVFFGIPFCWRWGLKGFFGTLAFLVVLFLLFYSSFSMEDRLWQIGIALTVILGLVITALSFKETSELVNSLELESQSRMENLLMLDKKFKKAQEEWEKQHASLQLDLKQKTDISTMQAHELSNLNALLNILQQEAQHLQENKKDLLEEAFQKTRKISQMEVELAESQESIQRLKALSEISNDERVNCLTKEIEDFKQHLGCKSNEIATLQKAFKEVKDKRGTEIKEIESYRIDIEDLKSSLSKKSKHASTLKEEILERGLFTEGLRTQIESLNAKLAEADQEVKHKDQVLLQNDETIQSLNQNIGNLTHSLNSCTHSLEEKVNTLKQLEVKFNDAHSEWHDKKAHLNHLIKQREENLNDQNAELTKKINIINQTQARLEEYKNRLTEFEKQNEILGSTHNAKEQEWQEYIDKMAKQLKQKEMQLQRQTEELFTHQKLIKDKEKALASLTLLQQQSQSIATEKIENLEKELDEAFTEHANLRAHINDTRINFFQLKQDHKALIKQPEAEASQKTDTISKEDIVTTDPEQNKYWLFEVRGLLNGEEKMNQKNLKNLPPDIVKEMKNLHQTKSLYKQLRQQFQDKSEMLDKAKQELFNEEGRYIELNKLREEDLNENNLMAGALEQDLSSIVKEYQLCEKEIHILNDIIRNLLGELESTKS